MNADNKYTESQALRWLGAGPRFLVSELAQKLKVEVEDVDATWRLEAPLPEGARARLAALLEAQLRELEMLSKALNSLDRAELQGPPSRE